MKRAIVTYPDPFLRKQAEQVDGIDDSTAELIRDMFSIMDEEDGVGLAAPQAGVSRRIIVISTEDRDVNRLALINPVVEFKSRQTEVMEEGCLSLPGVRADVARPVEVVVKGLSRSGRQVEISARNMLARVLQHEIDHLNGVLFIDRVGRCERAAIAAGLSALEERYSAIQTS